MLRIFLDYLKKYGFSLTAKKLCAQLNPKAMADFYLLIKGIASRDCAYRGPDWVQIDLTNNCNNNCIGCWCNSPLLREKRMDAQTKDKALPYPVVKDFIDGIHAMGTRRVVFSGGGEPLMHPQALDILRYAKKKRMVCQLHTNLTLVDERIAGELVDMRLDYLTVSLWAGSARTYKLTHPNKDEQTFYRLREILELISALKAGGQTPYIRLHNVITSLNYAEINEMLFFAREVKADAVSFAALDAISGYTDSLLLTPEQRKKLIKSAESLKNNHATMLFDFDEFIRRISCATASRGDYDKDIINSIPCYAGWLFARLNADGSVNPCLKSHRIPVGNIYRQGFSQIWNSEKQREFRRKTLRFEKNDAYFAFIGNEPNAAVGCWRGCDDFGMNVRAHRKLSLVLPLLNLLGALEMVKR